MLSKLRKWLGGRRIIEEGPLHAMKGATPPRPASNTAPDRASDSGAIKDQASGEIESGGPGKNALVRRKFVREDTGTHETLKIIDDSMLSTEEDEGIDPYNTGHFDKSRNWDRRFSK